MANTDALKEAYEAFGKGDMDTVTEMWADDVTWEGPAESTGLPGAGTHEGKDDIVKNVFQTIPENYDSFVVAPDEFHESGDTVIVLGHNEAKTKDSGNDIKVPFVHVWRFDDDKISRAQILTDTAVVKAALDD